MLKENLIMLRNIHGFSQERIAENIGISRQAPAGKSIWGTVTVNDRGQIVIPKDARDKYGITGGTRLIVVGDEVGIALIPAEAFEAGLKKAMESAYTDANKTD